MVFRGVGLQYKTVEEDSPFGWINIDIQGAFLTSSRWSSMSVLEFCFKTYCFVPCTTLHCFEKQWNVPWDKNACPLSKLVWVGDETDMRCHYPNMAHICFVRWPIFMSQPPTCVNSLRPGDAYMRQWNMPSLVQIMACRLLSAKPLSEPMMVYRKLEPQEQIQWKSDWNSNIFIKDNAFENVVCQSGGRFVSASMC